MTDFEVVVVGGGLAGACVAVGLGQLGMSVGLVDPTPPTLPQDQPKLRVSTLSPASQNILERLGVWSQIKHAGRTQKFTQMRVWDHDLSNEMHFHARDRQLPALGWVVENELVRGALWQALAPNAVTVHKDSLEQVKITERGARLTLADGQQLSATLAIGADGASSKIREAMQIDASVHSYQQQGLVAMVSSPRLGTDTAWQRFLAGGPLAFLPLFDGSHSIVWSLPDTDAMHLRNCAAAEFEQALSDATGERFGSIRCVSDRVCFPLRRMSAERYAKGAAVLVGDAAHVVHPLAGQGANLGLLDAAALIELLEEGKQNGWDVNNASSLRRYERWRKSDNELFANSLDWIKFAYQPQRGLLANLRGTATRLLSGNSWMRARLVEHASGFGGQLPALAKRR